MGFIKFLGTAGARFAVTQQVRRSGGIWISLDDTILLIDPGPGSLVRCLSSRPKLNPATLDGIILSHRHIDHANDINIMIEAMTNGGHSKRGVVYAPADALNNDPVILKHFRNHIQHLFTLKEGKQYHIKNLQFSTPVQHIHDVETYGLNIKGENTSISYISDTQYFEGIYSYYEGEILILNVVLLSPKSWINHLSIEDAEQIIFQNRPKLTILTHFGMTMLQSKPWELADQLTKKTGEKVIAASDGLSINLPLGIKQKE